MMLDKNWEEEGNGGDGQMIQSSLKLHKINSEDPLHSMVLTILVLHT